MYILPFTGKYVLAVFTAVSICHALAALDIHPSKNFDLKLHSKIFHVAPTNHISNSSIPRFYFKEILPKELYDASICVSNKARLLPHFKRIPDHARPPFRTSMRAPRANRRDTNTTTPAVLIPGVVPVECSFPAHTQVDGGGAGLLEEGQFQCGKHPLVTVVTVLFGVSANELDYLKRLARAWQGYISVTFQVTVEQIAVVQDVLQAVSSTADDAHEKEGHFVDGNGGIFERTVVHLWLVKDPPAVSRNVHRDEAKMFNAAIKAAPTDLVWPLSEGVIPSNNAYRRVQSMLSSSHTWRFRLWLSRTALIFHVVTVNSYQDTVRWSPIPVNVNRTLKHAVFEKINLKPKRKDIQWIEASTPYLDKPSNSVFVLFSKRSGILPLLWRKTALQDWYKQLKVLRYRFYKESNAFLIQYIQSKSKSSKEYEAYLRNKYNNITMELKDQNLIASFPECMPIQVEPKDPSKALVRCEYHYFPDSSVIQDGLIQLEKGMYSFSNFIVPMDAMARHDVTMVLHISAEKYSTLEFMTNRWTGPVSCVVFLVNQKQSLDGLLRMVMTHALEFRRWTFHIVIYEPEQIKNLNYPFNVLRELGLNAVASDLAFPLDVDFLPSVGLYEKFLLVTQNDIWGHVVRHQKGALIVPAFEMVPRSKLDYLNQTEFFHRMPATKNELMSNPTWVRPFHFGRYPKAHRATDYTHWAILDVNATDFFQVQYEKGFEPYFLLEKNYHGVAPGYSPRFRGFGYDKVAWVLELFAAEYQFFVLGGEFVIHLDHTYGDRSVDRKVLSNFFSFYCTLLPIYGTLTPDYGMVMRNNTALVKCKNQELKMIPACTGTCAKHCRIIYCK